MKTIIFRSPDGKFKRIEGSPAAILKFENAMMKYKDILDGYNVCFCEDNEKDFNKKFGMFDYNAVSNFESIY